MSKGTDLAYEKAKEFCLNNFDSISIISKEIDSKIEI